MLSRWRFLDLLLLPTLFAWFLIMAVAGIFVVPIGLLFTPRKAYHMPKLFWLWGNDTDSINGDEGWRLKCQESWILGHPRSMWSRYVWTALRNPARNWSSWVGPRPRDLAMVYSSEPDPLDMHCTSMAVLAFTESWRYPMYFGSWRVFNDWRIILKAGYKLWSVERDIHNGKPDQFQFVMYPQIKKRVCG